MNNNDKYAIIIGVSTYEDEGIPNLKYTVNDAVRLAKILNTKSDFKSSRLYLIADVTQIDFDANLQKPTRSNILNIIEYISGSSKEESEILLFFAGHGAEISKEPYILPSDTRMNVINQTAIDIRSINNMLQKSKSNCVVRIFDACRSGFGDSRSTIGRMTDGLQDAISFKATGWATLSSCSSGEFAFETSEFEQGVFSYYLCEALEGKAAWENDGLVTFERLVDYTKINVSNWCDRLTTKQTPHLVTDLSGTLVLTKNAVKTASMPVNAQNPLSNFSANLDSHILQASSDIRNLKFTDTDQLSISTDQLIKSINSITEGFSNNALTISVKEMGSETIQNSKTPRHRAFISDLNNLQVMPEFKEIRTIRCEFSSNDIIVPSTSLFISTVRFSFFYWLWWFHECNPKQLENKFTPSPAYKNRLITFKPEASINYDKVFAVTNEIFEQATSSIIEWSEQLRKFVDSRIDPLRKIGDIIE